MTFEIKTMSKVHTPSTSAPNPSTISSQEDELIIDSPDVQAVLEDLIAHKQETQPGVFEAPIEEHKPQEVDSIVSTEYVKSPHPDKLDINRVIQKSVNAHIQAQEEAKLKVISIPIKTLPSGFIPYPANAKVFYRTYAYQEIKDINSGISLIDQYNIMLAGIRTENFDKVDPILLETGNLYGDKRDLTFFDFLANSFYRKLSGFKTSKYVVPYKCPTCKAINAKHNFELEDINFLGLDIKELPIVVIMPSDNKEIWFWPLTIGRFMFLLENDLYYRKDSDGSYMIDDFGNLVKDEVAILASTILNMPFKEAYDYIANMNDMDDIALVESIDVMLNHGIAPLEFNCRERLGEAPNVEIDPNKPRDIQLPAYYADTRPFCGQKIFVKLQGEENLVLPFRESSQPLESRITFGIKRNS